MPEPSQATSALGSTWSIQAWATRFAAALTSMCGTEVRVDAQTEPASPMGPDAILWWGQEFSIAGAPLVWIGAPESTWKFVGNRILTCAGLDETEDSEVKGTYLEVLTQSLAGLAEEFSQRAGEEITATKGSESANPPSESQSPIAAQIRFDGETSLSLLVILAPSSVSGTWSALLQGAQDPLSMPASADADKNPPLQDPPPKTMGVLLDVELPLSLSFGRAQLPIKDVLKLSTGSIVELNRSVDEPVEVIVNNCVIARGEVVMVDGNYGVKIHHIVSPQERLRTLK